MPVTLYGIKNCDTIKKARKWLDENNIEYRFHDFRVEGINRSLIEIWLQRVGWETLLNTRSTSWRKLADAEKEALNESRAIALMLEHPTIIKRPVLLVTNRVYVGFKEESYREVFS